MSDHEPWEIMVAYADQMLDGEEARRVERHVAACTRCAATLADIRRGLDSLAEVPAEAAPARDLWHQIEGKLDARSGGLLTRVKSGRWMLRIAASVLIFIAGALVGRVTGPGERAGSGSHEESIAAHIQQAGTDYVNGVASLRMASPRLSAADREQGRQAAIAAIYGGVRELSLIAPDDRLLAGLVELATISRYAPTGLSF